VLSRLLDHLLEQLDTTGIYGLIIVLLIVAVAKLWAELRAERKRNEDLSSKMLEMAKETSILIERITAK